MNKFELTLLLWRVTVLACIPCSDRLPIAECIDDMVAYSQLNDSVIEHIRAWPSQSPELSQAKDLLTRLEKRQLYKFIGQSGPIENTNKVLLKVCDELL